jgi:hypothetical protein
MEIRGPMFVRIDGTWVPVAGSPNAEFPRRRGSIEGVISSLFPITFTCPLCSRLAALHTEQLMPVHVDANGATRPICDACAAARFGDD